MKNFILSFALIFVISASANASVDLTQIEASNPQEIVVKAKTMGDMGYGIYYPAIVSLSEESPSDYTIQTVSIHLSKDKPSQNIVMMRSPDNNEYNPDFELVLINKKGEISNRLALRR